LLPYWSSKAFDTSNYLIFEIKRGGWAEQEKQNGMLNSTLAFGTYREWFIVSSNACFNVIAERTLNPFSVASRRMLWVGCSLSPRPLDCRSGELLCWAQRPGSAKSGRLTFCLPGFLRQQQLKHP